MTTRRDWMTHTAIAAVGVGLGLRVVSSSGKLTDVNGFAGTDAEGTSVMGPAPWALIAPLTRGSVVGNGYSIASLSPVRDGAAELRLAHANGSVAEVHVCLRDGEPMGVAYSRHFDFVLMGHADGDAVTDERVGVVVMALADRARQNEEALSRAGYEAHRDRDVHATLVDRDQELA